MALVKYDSIQLSDPVWLFDPLHYWLLTPGALINRFDFPADVSTSLRTAKGGTVLMRRHGVPYFLKATTNLQTTEPTTLTAAAGVGVSVITVEFANFKAGDVLTIGATTPETKTVASVDGNQITLTTTIATARPSGDPVALNAAVDLGNDLNGEVVLLAQEYADLDRNQEIVNLRPNKGAQVRINFLPDYSGGQLISTTVEAKVRGLYNCFEGVA